MCCAVPAQRPERPSADAAQRTRASSLLRPLLRSLRTDAQAKRAVGPVAVTPGPHRARWPHLGRSCARRRARHPPRRPPRTFPGRVRWRGTWHAPPTWHRSISAWFLTAVPGVRGLSVVRGRARARTDRTAVPNCAASSRIAGSCCRALGHWSSCACPYVCGVVPLQPCELGGLWPGCMCMCMCLAVTS